MTNWEYIKTLDADRIARLISLSVIPSNESEPMFICGVGHFDYEEDFRDWLNAEREQKNDLC